MAKDYTSARAEFSEKAVSIDEAWQWLVRGFQEKHRLFRFIGGSASFGSEPVGEGNSPIVGGRYEFEKVRGTRVDLVIDSCSPNKELSFFEYIGVTENGINISCPNFMKITLEENSRGINFSFDRVDIVGIEKQSFIRSAFSLLSSAITKEEKYHRSSEYLFWILGANRSDQFPNASHACITKESVDQEIIQKALSFKSL